MENFKRAEIETLKSEDAKQEKIRELTKELFTEKTPEEYSKFIVKAKFIELSAPYAESLYIHLFEKNSNNEDLSKLGITISDAIRNEIVLDLGCGKTNYMARFAKNNTARLYIGVDLNPDVLTPVAKVAETDEEAPWYLHSAPNTVRRKKDRSYLKKESNSSLSHIHPREESSLKKITEPRYDLQDNVLQVQDDMLRTISRIKNESIKVIIMSGIEISTENMKETDEYLKKLDKEIKRVLKKDGLLLINQSDFSPEDNITITQNREQEWKLQKKKEQTNL